MTASAGVAPIKFLAKVDSDLNKPNGIFVISPNHVDSFIDDMALSKIPGVGKVTNEKLQSDNLRYGRDVKALNQELLTSKYGKLGTMLWDRCSGNDDRPIVVNRERKSVGVEITFPEDISDLSILDNILTKQLLPELKKRAEKHLIDRGIGKVGVKVKFSDFHQTTKEFSTDNINIVILSELLTEAFARGNGKKVRLIGIHLGLSSHKNEVEQLAFEW